MQIVVNTRLLLPNKLEGIGFFTCETLKRITREHPEHHFIFLFDRHFDEEFLFSDNITPLILSPQARHPFLFYWWFEFSVAATLNKLKPDLFLSPGMFGNMRLASGASERALLVPDAAVQTDQARKTLLVVGKDGQVAAREVRLGPVVDGLRVVRGGIASTNRIVITGTQLAQPGTKVQTRAGRITPVAETAAPPSQALVGEATFAR